MNRVYLRIPPGDSIYFEKLTDNEALIVSCRDDHRIYLRLPVLVKRSLVAGVYYVDNSGADDEVFPPSDYGDDLYP